MGKRKASVVLRLLNCPWLHRCYGRGQVKPILTTDMASVTCQKFGTWKTQGMSCRCRDCSRICAIPLRWFLFIRFSEALGISWNIPWTRQSRGWNLQTERLGLQETSPVVSCFMGSLLLEKTEAICGPGWSLFPTASTLLERSTRQFGKVRFCDGLIPYCFCTGRAAYHVQKCGRNTRQKFDMDPGYRQNYSFWKGTLTYNLL